MSTLRERLVAVGLRLKDPARWTKGALARDAQEREVPPGDPAACCWCLVGAVWAETPEADGDAAYELLDLLEEQGPRELTGFNDEALTTHEDVLALLRRTLRALKEKPT